MTKIPVSLMIALSLAMLVPWPLAAQSDARTSTGTTNSSDSESGNQTTSLQQPEVKGDQFEPTHVLAMVGGEPIFVGDVLFEVNQLIAQYMSEAPESVRQRERPAIMQKLLPKFIEQKMLLIDVRNGLPEGAKFDDIVESASKEFDEKAMEEMMKSAGVDSPVMFDAHLRAQGSSLRKLRYSWTVNQIVRYFLQEKIKSDAEVSHQELLTYYRDHEAEYSIKPRARWEQVMVRHEKFASTKEAMHAIVEMGNSIVYGASLEGVAKKSSHGFGASEGGQHDWTSKGSLVSKELDAAIFSLPIGQLSDVIQSDQGFHIIRVIERQDADKVDFGEAQIAIRKKLENEKRLAAYDAHLKKLKQDIPVEIMDAPARAAQDKPSAGNLIR